jgi:hypothetical protein
MTLALNTIQISSVAEQIGGPGSGAFFRPLDPGSRINFPDPQPGLWIRIRIDFCCWIRIRIRIQKAIPNPDPGGQKSPP